MNNSMALIIKLIVKSTGRVSQVPSHFLPNMLRRCYNVTQTGFKIRQCFGKYQQLLRKYQEYYRYLTNTQKHLHFVFKRAILFSSKTKQHKTTNKALKDRKIDLMLQMLQYCYISKSLLTSGFCSAIMVNV